MLFGLIYLIIGAFGGLIIGFLGTGSSLVTLPALSLIFPLILPPDIAIKMAVGTCVATLVIGALLAALSNIKKGHWNKILLIKMTIPCIIGAGIAPGISNYLPTSWLHYYIGVFILIIAFRKLLSRKAKAEAEIEAATEPKSNSHTHSTLEVIFVSFFAALLSGMAGVALGIILIPYLHRSLNHRDAVGTSLVASTLYAFIATLGYIYTGWHADAPWSLGYVYLPAFIFLIITISIFTPIGVRLSHRLPVQMIQKAFYLFLAVAGILILI